MGTPFFLADNLFSRRAYPGHLLSVNSEATGHELLYLADARRSVYDYFTSEATNTDITIVVDCQVNRQVNSVIFDRGHNLTGKTVQVDDSTNGTSWTNRTTFTVPSSGANLTYSNVAVTEDGAFGTTWTAAAAIRFHRVVIPAMGAGLKPVIVGLWLGMSYSPTYIFAPSASSDGGELVGSEVPNEQGWYGRGPALVQRSGTISLRFEASEYTTARPTLQHYLKGRPMWIAHDRTAADQMFLGILPFNTHLDPNFRSRNPRELDLIYREHEPLRP